MAAKYTIRDLEHLSGIKAHTLRIWEQRYGIIVPERTSTNIRWYTSDELKKLLNISMLNSHGIKISRLAQMSEEEIARQVAELIDRDGYDSEYITSLVIAAVEMDEERFEKIFSGCVLRQGFESTIGHVLLPFLRKIRVMWQTGAVSLAQEHFIINLVRQKIIVAIDGCVTKTRPGYKHALVFLPFGEFRELSLLCYHYLLRSSGHKSTYLGQSVPFDDLVAASAIQKYDLLITVLTEGPRDISVQSYIDKLRELFPSQRLLLSGVKVIGKVLDLPENTTVFNGPEELKAIIEQLPV